MRLEDLDYDLDPSLIAQTPIEPRDAARLLIDRGAAAPEHRQVRDLPEYLGPGDVVVVNETKVIPARLRLRRHSGGAAEVLLLEPVDGPDGDWMRWEALVRPARRLKRGERLTGPDGRDVVVVGERTAAGDTFTVTLVPDEASSGRAGALDLLERYGEMPLPPYIHSRLDVPDRYQTVYANEPGSAAAPTAGLHLTPSVLDAIRARGATIVPVELVVGLDTFAPVTEDNPLDHHMHSERYHVPASSWDAIQHASRVVAVGTTSARAIESAAAAGRLDGRTELFLHAGSPVQVVDVLLTNFHMPRTTLLMLIEAVIGERWRRLYAEATVERYRFFSFGDAMLLDRHADG